jgi:VWFA-related protein
LQSFAAITVFALPLCPLSLSPSSAQGKNDAQIKVESRLVLVDLIVTDNEGRFVPDLKPDEIQIFEDNKRREISFFEHQRRGSQPTGRSARSPVVREPGGAVVRGSEGGAVAEGVTLVFMIDGFAISPVNLLEVRRVIADYARSNTRPGDSLMLVSAGTVAQAYQAPTRDVGKFLRALESVSPSEDTSSRLLRFGEELEILLKVASDANMGQDELNRRAIALGREYILKEEKIARGSCDSATALIKQIASLPGRKNVLFFSSGYHLKIAPAIQDILLQALIEASPSSGGRQGPPTPAGSQRDGTSMQVRSMLGTMTSMQSLDSRIRSVVDEANRSQVAFYTVDVRALMTTEDVRFRDGASYSGQLMREEITQPQEFLRDMASGTGGRWFLNRNDLDAGIASAHQDLEEHYELGYVPQSAAKPGTLHQITIKLLRPNVQVIHRRSYVEPGELNAEQRVVENGIKFTELFQDFPIEVDTTYRGKRLKVTVFVPVRFLQFSRSGDRYRGELSVTMALFDGAGNLYRDKIWFSKTYNLDYGEAEYASLIKSNNVTSACQGTVPAGNYTLKVVVRQPTASKTAALAKLITSTE